MLRRYEEHNFKHTIDFVEKVVLILPGTGEERKILYYRITEGFYLERRNRFPTALPSGHSVIPLVPQQREFSSNTDGFQEDVPTGSIMTQIISLSLKQVLVL